MKRFTASLALVLALITILSACGPAASNSETTEATLPTTATGAADSI